MTQLHEMRDSDNHFIIDPVTMAITNRSEKHTLQQGNHNSEIFTFEIPKSLEGHDTSLCNTVEIHYINIKGDRTEQSEDIYSVKDMVASEDDPDALVFTWRIHGNATLYAGSLNFRIKFACKDENGNYTYKKWTEIFKGISVSEGFDNAEAVEKENSDILAQWEAQIDALMTAKENGEFNYVLTDADKEEIAGMVGGAQTTINLLHLPEKYNLVVGDAFELFYKGIMLCKNPYDYNIRVTCPIGKPWGRKFEVTPTTEGEYTLKITVSDDAGNVLDEKTTKLVVAEKNIDNTRQLNVLCVGDSLTSPGQWVGEFYRRLTSTNAVALDGSTAPTGDGLANINFVGTCEKYGACYEGYGGWKFSNYLDTTKSSENYWVTCTHSKTDNDQESIYKDANDVLWQLETIETNKIKFKPYEGSGVMPSSGTLTWVSGGLDTTDITYTAIEQEKGSPFVYNGEIDFSAYCEDLGISTIHQCYILLGWNNTTTKADDYKAQAKQFIDLLLAFNPDMKIILVGLQIPSLDGLANDYGANHPTLSNFRGLQEYVFNLDNLYKEIADEYENVESINLSGQFDTDYNITTKALPVNLRNSTTVVTGTNGVHPSTQGYYQIADAVYRKFYAVWEKPDLLGLDERTAVFRNVRLVTDTTTPREMALDKMYYFDSRAGFCAGSEYVFSITDLAVTKDSLQYVGNTTGTQSNFVSYGLSVPLGLEDGKTYTVSAKQTSYSTIYLQTYAKDGDMWTYETSVSVAHTGNNVYSSTFTAEAGKGYALLFAVGTVDAIGALSEFTNISIVEAE